MAKQTRKVDVYNVYDKDGNVEGTVRYAEGTEEYEKAKAAREAGDTFRVFKSNKEGAEEYTPTYKADVTVRVDPAGGRILVDGPDWLTKEVVQSDTFKQNYSQNKALLSAVSLYRKDPSATVTDTSTGEAMNVGDVIKVFEDSASAYGNQFALITDIKDSFRHKYGAALTDEDVAIASSTYNKNDNYDKDGLVYVPSDMLDTLDWEDADSWNPENKTLTAEDFFNKVYSVESEENWNDLAKVADFEDRVVKKMEGFLAYNSYDESDEEEAKAHQDNIGSKEYASDLARTSQLFSIVSQNKPELAGRFNLAMGAISACNSFSKRISEDGLSISSGILQFTEAIANDKAGLPEQLNFANPIFIGAFMLGEAFSMLDYRKDNGMIDFGEGFQEMTSDLEMLTRGEKLGDKMNERRQNILAKFDAINKYGVSVTDAWNIGDVVGDFVAMAVEQKMIINKVGVGAERFIKNNFNQIAAKAAGPLGKMMSSRAVGGMMNVLAKSTNVVSQGLIETFMHEKDLVDKAFKDGHVSNELIDKFLQNSTWNAVAEIAPWGISRAHSYMVKTAFGQVLDAGATKIMATKAYYKYKLLHKLFKFLNKGEWQEEIGDMTARGAKAAIGSRALGRFNTSMFGVLADAFDTLRKIPVFGELSPEIARKLEDAVELVRGWDGTEIVLSKSTAPELADKLGEIYAASSKDLEALAKEADMTVEDYVKQMEREMLKATGSATKEVEAATNVKSLRERIEKNWQAMRKQKYLIMNLENQIDMISKGISIRMTEIQTFAGKTLEDYENSVKRLGELERDVEGLTYSKYAHVISRESSEIASYTSQQLRLTKKIARADAEGWKAAGFKSQADLDATREYSEQVANKLEELRAKVGDELYTHIVDDFLPKLARYTESIDDYMMRHGFYDEELAGKITSWRESGDWVGEDGRSRYIHTSRLFMDNGEEQAMRNFASMSENPSAFTRKVVSDDAYFLKPGNVADSFIDPNTVASIYLYNAARVAQGQSFARALHGISLPMRAVKGFSDDGITKAEASVLGRDLQGEKRAFTTLMGKTGFQDALKDALDVTDAISQGGRAIFQSKSIPSNAALKKAAAKMKAAGEKLAPELVNNASIDHIDNLLKNLPDEVALPNLDMSKVTPRNLTDWFNSLGLSNKSKLYIQTRLASAANKPWKDVTSRDIKRIFRQDPEQFNLIKKAIINDSSYSAGIKASSQYKEFLTTQLAETMKSENSILKKSAEKYNKLVESYKNLATAKGFTRVDFKNLETFGENYAEKIIEVKDKLVSNLMDVMRTDPNFLPLAERMAKASNGAMTVEEAQEYIVLQNLAGMKQQAFYGQIQKAVESTFASFKSPAMRDVKLHRQFSNLIAKNIKSEIDSSYNVLMGKYAKSAPGAIDLDEYFSAIKGEMAAIEDMGLTAKRTGNVTQVYMNEAGRTHLVELVDPDGTLRFYETSPLYAGLVNYQPSMSSAGSNAISDFLLQANGSMNVLFRYGTTGIDRTSYINQWFRDTLNALLVGGAGPLTDLTPGGFRSTLSAVGSDFIPFGQKLFGKRVTETLTDEMVNITFAASERGLAREIGQEGLDALKEAATKGVAPEAAEWAYKRAVVEYAADTTGFGKLPGLGGMTEAKFYSEAIGGGKTQNELRKEAIEGNIKEMGGEASTKSQGAFMKNTSTLREKFADFFSSSSRGQWREEFWRKKVYAAQYRAAIEAGCTMEEAKAFAFRYAMDATTDFNRSFAFGNKFIKSVPYLGAAINGYKSFMRLLELDPAGISTRFIFGAVIPYMALVAQGLTDEDSRKVYKNIPEYEKSDNLIFMHNGTPISIPIPQELSGFLAPFRHMVEKSADAQDASWNDLIVSDVLGLSPIDLSGFVDIDANTLLSGTPDDPTDIAHRISRGMEKALSTLMPPAVKAVYMATTKRDPYTGKEINTSYVYTDAEGNTQIMDYTQSYLAGKVAEIFPELGKSGALKVLQTLLGRSTISVLDGAADIITGDVTPEGALNAYLDAAAEDYGKPMSVNVYEKSKSEWKKAINAAYEKKDALMTDKEFNNAYKTLQTAEPGSEKYKNAMVTYKEKLDDFTKYVLEITKSTKENYPDSYTKERVAQVLSLLTISSVNTVNETAYSEEVRKNAYYDARNTALDTMLELGFTEDMAGVTVLGTGSYDKEGKFVFKVFTPYEIEAMANDIYGTSRQVQATIKQAIEDAGIEKNDMWAGYYKANSKADKKEWKQEWNKRVLTALYPVLSKYGPDTILNSSDTIDLLDNYIFVDNPYKTKQYLNAIFKGGE